MIPVLVAVFYLPFKNHLLFASGIFAVAAATDWVDGYLARRLGQMTKLGAFLDPVADKLIVSVALIMLVDFYPSDTHWYISVAALIIISREILVSALREWMGTIGQRSSVNVSSIGKVKTFVQIFAILFLLYQQPFFGLPSFEIGVVLLMAATLLTLWSGFIYLREGVKTFDN